MAWRARHTTGQQADLVSVIQRTGPAWRWRRGSGSQSRFLRSHVHRLLALSPKARATAQALDICSPPDQDRRARQGRAEVGGSLVGGHAPAPRSRRDTARRPADPPARRATQRAPPDTEQRVPVPEIAGELRVSERSVQRWRRSWEAGGTPGLASKGQAARCRLDDGQLAELDRVLDAGPAAAGWEDQRWTLARIADLIAARFKVRYTVPGTWYLPAGRAGAASWARAAPSSGTTAPSRSGKRRPGRG
jgi:hypothetical protein